MKASATLAVGKWEEVTYHQVSPEVKLTKCSVEYAFSGEMEGKASVEYIMYYSHVDAKDQHKSVASYFGLMRFEGRVAGKTGSFVMKDIGAFQGGTAISALQIGEGSGTGSLLGITGTASYRADAHGSHFELKFELPS